MLPAQGTERDSSIFGPLNQSFFPKCHLKRVVVMLSHYQPFACTITTGEKIKKSIPRSIESSLLWVFCLELIISRHSQSRVLLIRGSISSPWEMTGRWKILGFLFNYVFWRWVFFPFHFWLFSVLSEISPSYLCSEKKFSHLELWEKMNFQNMWAKARDSSAWA